MTNSINNLDYVRELVENKVKVKLTEVVDPQQIAFEIEKDDIHLLLSALKSAGWKQLSYLSAVDWPEENKFELVYILFNWDKPVYIQIRSKIDRENPVVDSILPMFPGAKYYEREAHEFFGISFPGNPDHHKQLILEEWDDIPPLRKDFDPAAYSDRKFPKREMKADYSVTSEDNNRKAKRAQRKARAQSLRTGGAKQ